jgi:uncharacterized membrane protein
MSALIVAIYPEEQRAASVLVSLQQEQIVSPLKLNDAVSVTRSTAGRVRLHRRSDRTGIVGGAFWPMLVGLLLLIPRLGVMGTARAGIGWETFRDYGIDETFVQALDAQLVPGRSAVFVLVWSALPDGVIPAVCRYGGTVLQTALGREADVRLRDALNHSKAGVIAVDAV